MKRTSWLGRRRTLHAVSALVGAAVAWGIVSTYDQLSHTVDEPTHIASGLEWIESGTQRLHPENPPLGRIGAGVSSWLAGYPMPGSGTAPQRGTELLYSDGDYLTNLRRARLGTLPFFLLTAFLVWHWAEGLAGARAGLLAVLSVVTLPPLLGHAGLATTDLPFVAFFVLLVRTFAAWLERTTVRSSIGLGAAAGLSMATKYSTLIFFPAAALAILLGWRLAASRDAPRSPAPARGGMLIGAVIALPVAALLVWAAFRFDIGRLDDIPAAERAVAVAFPDEHGLGRTVAEGLSALPLPAPDALHGLIFLKAHTNLGHPAYLMGERSDTGFPWFYLVALSVKTPLTFALLLGLGVVGAYGLDGLGRWRALTPAVAAAAVLAMSMLSTINIGLRHVLVVYPLFAVAAGLGLDALLVRLPDPRRRLMATLVVLALGWQAALVARSFPNFLSWFNPLAGEEPGRVLVDSDLDWGQDVLQLARLTEDLDVPLLSVALFGSVRLCEHGLPPLEWLSPGQPASGWVAISEMYFRDHWRVTYEDACDRGRGAGHAPAGLSYDWLRRYDPVAMAGRSIRLYHLPAQ